MLKALAVALAPLFLAQAASAATVTVKIDIQGTVETQYCANLGCLVTGVGDTPSQDPGAPPEFGQSDFTATLRFSMPEADLTMQYNSQPGGPDFDVGYRALAFSGTAMVDFLMHGHVSQFSSPIAFYMNDLWPAYGLRIWQTFGFQTTGITPLGVVKLQFHGERSIPYVAPPAPYSGAPVVDQSYSVLGGYSEIIGDSYWIYMNPNQFDLQIDVDQVAPVPLPASGVLLALGLAALAVRTRPGRRESR